MGISLTFFSYGDLPTFLRLWGSPYHFLYKEVTAFFFIERTFPKTF
jgi:hypothetical protein